MQQATEELKIPLFVLEIGKDETDAVCVDDIIAHLRNRIEAHSYARYIGLFDHFAHTEGLPDGEIAPGIRDARNVVFCFGMAIPEPVALATRPRSIGVCELDDRFVITFLEPPMPIANTAMEAWVRSLARKSCEHAGNEPAALQQ